MFYHYSLEIHKTFQSINLKNKELNTYAANKNENDDKGSACLNPRLIDNSLVGLALV